MECLISPPPPAPREASGGPILCFTVHLNGQQIQQYIEAYRQMNEHSDTNTVWLLALQHAKNLYINPTA